jgi:hypothetical protein
MNPDEMPEFQVKRLEQYDAIVKACRDLFTEKNIQYRDSIAECGVLGTVVSLNGIMARLRHLVISAPDAGENAEGLAEICKDGVVYFAATLMLMADENWKPK